MKERAIYSRDQLAHAVIWPDNGTVGVVELVDTWGHSDSGFELQEPITGAELARKVPEHCGVALVGARVISLTGPVEVCTVGEFDTGVNTEKREPDEGQQLQIISQQMQRLTRAFVDLRQENDDLRRDRQRPPEPDATEGPQEGPPKIRDRGKHELTKSEMTEEKTDE